MSRTYRRKGHNSYKKIWLNPLEDWYLEYEEVDFSQIESISIQHLGYFYIEAYSVVYKKDSKKGKELLSKWHSDSGTVSFKEPGPKWWRNLTTERPLRRKNKRELKKYLTDPEYEPMCEERGKLDYWT